jgi:hypothetical protein
MTEKTAPAAEQSAIETAAATVAMLQEKLAQLDAHVAENAKARSTLSFAALAGDDKTAKKQLHDLTSESLRLGSDRENLMSALAEAERQHKAVIRDVQRAAEAGEAAEIADLFVRLIGLSKRCDELADALINQFVAIKGTLDEITSSSSPYPSSGQGRIALHTRLNTIVQSIALQWGQNFEYTFLAPGDRITSLTDHCERWRQGPFKQWFAERVGEPPAVAAE